MREKEAAKAAKKGLAVKKDDEPPQYDSPTYNKPMTSNGHGQLQGRRYCPLNNPIPKSFVASNSKSRNSSKKTGTTVIRRSLELELEKRIVSRILRSSKQYMTPKN